MRRENALSNHFVNRFLEMLLIVAVFRPPKMPHAFGVLDVMVLWLLHRRAIDQNADVARACQACPVWLSIKMMCSSNGPCTPNTGCISMSDVREQPVMSVMLLLVRNISTRSARWAAM